MERIKTKKGNQPDGARPLGIVESIHGARDFAVHLSQNQLAKVDEYLQTHPNLTDVQRWKIEKTRNELETHVQEVDEALESYARLLGMIERHTPTRHQALQEIDKARERALRAEIKNNKLLTKITALCPGMNSPYQANEGEPDGNR